MVGEGEGKSGCYFMFSKDQRIIIKSVRKSEYPFLVRIMMGYYEHIEANTFHSLLPRYLGLYKIKLPNRPVERLVVMNNLFHVPGPEPRPKIMQKFDLKGSLLKR